jgi:hypothetical protein
MPTSAATKKAAVDLRSPAGSKRTAPPRDSGRSPTRDKSRKKSRRPAEEGEFDESAGNGDTAAANAAAAALVANAQAAALVAASLLQQQAPPAFPPLPPASTPAVSATVAGTATPTPGQASQPASAATQPVSTATANPGTPPPAAAPRNPLFSEVSICLLQALAAGNPQAKSHEFFVPILEVLVDSGCACIAPVCSNQPSSYVLRFYEMRHISCLVHV